MSYINVVAKVLSLVARPLSTVLLDSRQAVVDLHFNPFRPTFDPVLGLSDVIDYFPSISLSGLQVSIRAAVRSHFCRGDVRLCLQNPTGCAHCQIFSAPW